ncbi:hypothetical protein HNP46_004267 [Pseudomonas nitritireducens]|uniref:Uncharacterized protein n=1 Tax=Pseudomonas nitroreducens TaxID=46680 RepID=A0A7W7P2A4_PSENT|nr:hypothetical protein [Pseudomonas nitritireducens]MBB4865386.1 hypothetical protein [Pseudomonas nitritireducens]
MKRLLLALMLVPSLSMAATVQIKTVVERNGKPIAEASVQVAEDMENFMSIQFEGGSVGFQTALHRATYEDALFYQRITYCGADKPGQKCSPLTPYKGSKTVPFATPAIETIKYISANGKVEQIKVTTSVVPVSPNQAEIEGKIRKQRALLESLTRRAEKSEQAERKALDDIAAQDAAAETQQQKK